MKKAGWIMAAVMFIALLIGAAVVARGQAAPNPAPADDPDLILDLGLDPADADLPPPGAPMGRNGGMGARGMGPGMMGQGMGPGMGPGMGQGMGPGMMGGPGEAGPMMQRKQEALERIKKDDPERYQRITKIRDLAMEYRDSDNDKRKKEIEKELKPLVEQELRIQQENNKKRVAELEKRLERMKKVLKQRDQNWDQVVDYTVKDITGQNDYLKTWRGGAPRK
ncbi:MAG TPA: hypothetical protein VM658_07055 [bacterium]|nr:hypothetical protein [bacterium]